MKSNICVDSEPGTQLAKKLDVLGALCLRRENNARWHYRMVSDSDNVAGLDADHVAEFSTSKGLKYM